MSEEKVDNFVNKLKKEGELDVPEPAKKSFLGGLLGNKAPDEKQVEPTKIDEIEAKIDKLSERLDTVVQEFVQPQRPDNEENATKQEELAKRVQIFKERLWESIKDSNLSGIEKQHFEQLINDFELDSDLSQG